jgi:hypothetical protein
LIPAPECNRHHQRRQFRLGEQYCDTDSRDQACPGMTNPQVISELLKPYDARVMRCYPVSTRINHVANDDPECSRPEEPAQIQDRLFQL